MKIEIKALHELTEEKLPDYQTKGAAAIDMIAAINEPFLLLPGALSTLIPLGVAINIKDPGVAALLLPRSGSGHKQGLVLGNGVGLIDSDYQGEIFMSACVRPGHQAVTIMPGDRIAQLMFVPVLHAEMLFVDEFSAETERGTGGFGSTGV